MKDKDKKDLEQRYHLKEIMTLAEERMRAELPKPDDKNYQLEVGKQSAYSHIWLHMKDLKDKFDKEDKSFINWKVMNLLIGFVLGACTIVWLFNMFKNLTH